MFELGRSLRYRYDGFLSSKYIPAGIAVISSDVDRCIMSAQLLLAGLYPPEGIQKWNPDLPWQPVPVHSLPPECDKVSITDYSSTSLLKKKLGNRYLAARIYWKSGNYYQKSETGSQISIRSIYGIVYDDSIGYNGREGRYREISLIQLFSQDILNCIRKEKNFKFCLIFKNYYLLELNKIVLKV